jgi:hypothetical protein
MPLFLFLFLYTVMCSLQITPACNMPLMSIKNGGKVAIVNLQVCATEYKRIVVCLKYGPKKH